MAKDKVILNSRSDLLDYLPYMRFRHPPSVRVLLFDNEIDGVGGIGKPYVIPTVVRGQDYVLFQSLYSIS